MRSQWVRFLDNFRQWSQPYTSSTFAIDKIDYNHSKANWRRWEVLPWSFTIHTVLGQKWAPKHPRSNPWILCLLPCMVKWVIKLRILKETPRISNHMHPCKDECERDTCTEEETRKRGRGTVMTEAEAESCRPPQVREGGQPSKSERREELSSPLESYRQHSPANTLIWTSGLWKNKILSF